MRVYNWTLEMKRQDQTGRKYSQIIYLIKNSYPKYLKNSHIPITKTKQTTQFKSDQKI